MTWAGSCGALLIAFDRGDLTKVPFSDDVDAESRLLMRRNVRDRVAALAPFLTFDQDPYIVVGDDGTAVVDHGCLHFVGHLSLFDALRIWTTASVNYMRNSVKVVVDAYDGTTTFYVFDSEDPIIAAWREDFSGNVQGCVADAAVAAQARALSGAVAEPAGGGLRALSHDES